MSIKKRLIFSNLGMIFIPIAGFLFVEMILGYVMFVLFNGNPQGSDLQLFFGLRLIAMILILVITNGLLTYYVSRSIMKPITELAHSAKEIQKGDLNYSVATDRKDELGELSRTFEDMRLSLKQAKADQAKYEQNRRELIASISHDLSTPLTSIKGYVRGIQDGIANTPEKLERYMDVINKAASDMDTLIDSLFQYSKLDIEQVPLKMEKVDLHSYFADFIDELAFDLEKEGGTATLHVNEKKSYLVEADREQLRRVVTNIVQNSFKYIDKDRKKIAVHLKSENQDQQARVEIKDNGSGIAKEDIPHLFESFYRTDVSRNSSTGGSGLGLAIVKRIIEAHGGEVWAESEPGEGTSVYFTLKKVSS